jgi:hypothetical protein
MATTITIPYKPRFPMTDIHKQLEAHRFNILVAHRRMGKSVGTINHTIKMAMKNSLWQPRYAYIAPYRNQAKLIIWEYLKYYTKGIPGVKVNEAELYVEFLGRRVYLFGADNPDSIRGAYWDGVVLDEYAQIKPEVWGEIIMPALLDRKGWAVFSGTPKGQNHFYDVTLTAQKLMNDGDENWWCGIFRADETKVISEEELELVRKSISENQFRQEFLCDFTASAENVLITIDIVTDASKKTRRPEEILGAPRILGVDVARFGGDKSVIFRRQGLQAFNPRIFEKIDNMTFAGCVAQEIQSFNPDAVFIDAGRGEGVIDRLRQLGFQVTEVNFGGTALNHNHYENRRSEMWDGMKQWLEAGGCIPNDYILKTDLVTPSYSLNKRDKFQLESKDDIKKRLGRSPDLADALALTFAMPVAASGDSGNYANRLHFATAGYNPIQRNNDSRHYATSQYNPIQNRRRR